MVGATSPATTVPPAGRSEVSSFTAVNGQATSTGAGAAGSPSSAHGGFGSTGKDERQASMRHPSSVHEKLSLKTNTTPGIRPGSPHSTPGSTTQLTSDHNQLSTSHKRKRSDTTHQPPGPHITVRTHDLTEPSKHVLPPTIVEPRGPHELPQAGSSSTSHRDAYHVEHRNAGHGQVYRDDREPASAQEPWSAQQFSAISQLASPDDRLREALTQNMDAEPSSAYDGGRDTPLSDDRGGHGYPVTPSELEDAAMRSEAKKRKRNFSNRTKTGCMTCRKRKKKCDEGQPECNNCRRGGFVCSGYQIRGQWPKVEVKQLPVPLQSKTEYEAGPGPPPPYGTPSSASSHREPLPGHRGQVLRVDPQMRKPDDESMSSASAISPENNRLSAISFSQQTPTPISATNSVYAERAAAREFSRMPPIHDAGKPESRTDSDTPQSAKASMSHILHPQLQVESPQVAQVAAQMALSHPASASVRPRTQKEEMLAGQHYFPFDKELVLERERCNGACWRFNSSTNPNNGVSPEERARLFRDILQPREQVVSPTQASPNAPAGRVGPNVVVEAPFTCDYGYNITIGQDVAIGKNCTILDTCEVRIGDRCNIGPNVNIYTASLPIDPKRRLGSRGHSVGSRIVIEADCWIGGGVTILPGRTIHKGSVVGAGSVVTRDVPPYTIACGNPARVIRAVYGDQ